MKDDFEAPFLDEWLQATEVAPPDPYAGARRVASELSHTRQAGRWLPFLVFHRKAQTPTTIDTIEYQPVPIAAMNGHSATITGRTRSMFSPVKAITAGALVFAIGGVMLIAQPFDQQGSVPGAATDTGSNGPVQFTAYVDDGGPCVFGTMTRVDGAENLRGYRCDESVEASDSRFTGTWSFVLNEDGYYNGEVDTIWTMAYRVVNAEGAWQSSPTSGIEFDDREMTVAAIFTGEGAYEGQTAIVEIRGGDKDSSGSSEFDLRGAIFGGPPPPPPDSMPTE